jgi:PrgI family protein
VSRTHEVPNHLNVQDTLFLGLTARQVATFMAFTSLAYGSWDQLTIAPLAVRGALAALFVVAGFALVQPAGRPPDEWAFAVFAHMLSPRQLCCCRPEVDPVEWLCSARRGGSSSRHDWGGRATLPTYMTTGGLRREQELAAGSSGSDRNSRRCCLLWLAQ